MKKVLFAVVALGAALTVSLPGAFARTEAPKAPQATPGVTSKSITIGGSFPFSGPVSSYSPIARGEESYFRFVNARKGPEPFRNRAFMAGLTPRSGPAPIWWPGSPKR